MTVGEWLLVGSISATLVAAGVGAGVGLYVHTSRAKWRNKEHVTPFIVSWREQVEVPDFREVAYSWVDKAFRLPVEDDAYFEAASKLCGKELRQQYQEFKRVTSRYIGACSKLWNSVAQDCINEARLPLGHGPYREWPAKVLTPTCVVSVYTSLLEQSSITDKNMSYNIARFDHSGRGYERKGLYLTLTCDILDFQNAAIAEASEGGEALLKEVERVHRRAMGAEYLSKFGEISNQIHHLKDEAERVAEQVRYALRRLEIS